MFVIRVRSQPANSVSYTLPLLNITLLTENILPFDWSIIIIIIVIIIITIIITTTIIIIMRRR